MEGHELFTRINKVKAPEGFEAGVMARLAGVRQRRERVRRAALRTALAGSAAVAVAAVVLLAPGLLRRGAGPALAERGELFPASESHERLMPVFETMEYASELRTASREPKTIYLLEEVSETISPGIIY